MASKRFPAQATVKSAAFAIAPQPLGQADWLNLQNLVAEMAPDWSVELIGICSDEASLVIVPEDGDDALGPTFAISRETYGLRLDKLHWDELTEVGVFACLDEVVDAVSELIDASSGYSKPAFVTLH
jgi:hypothetical protein